MKYGSVCSGIEAASVAWEPLGFSPAWFSEIEAFPSAVLAHHWPDVPNLGDMLSLPDRVTSGDVSAPDVLVGGTPCQAFSVAGARKGLADDRGQLTIKFVELANAIDAKRVENSESESIVVWENVPGVLSSKDNAFGAFLGLLSGEDCALEPPGPKWANAGYVHGPQRTIAWRVLDAQYFGVAQRRRRVFVVASARANFNPAKVLFEREGVRRDIAPSREAGQDVAINAGNSVKSPSHWDGGPHPTLNQSHNTGGIGASNQELFSQREAGIVGQKAFRMTAFGQHADDESSSTVKARDYKDATDLAVTVALRGREGGATAELGGEVATCLRASSGGGDKPHVLATRQVAQTITQNYGKQPDNSDTALGPNLALHDLAVRRLTPVECERLQGFPDNHTNVPYKIKIADPAGAGLCAKRVVRATLVSASGRYFRASNYVSHPQKVCPRGADDDYSACHAICVQSGHAEVNALKLAGKLAKGGTLYVEGHERICENCQTHANQAGVTSAVIGAPPGNALDGPRYKAIGNSMAVPCMAWIGERIKREVLA